MANRLTPRVAGDWQLLYKPTTSGCYVNDHTVLQAHDGSWHLFGITRDDPEVMPDRERWFTHGRGETLLSETGFIDKGRVCDNGTRAWAPSVISDGERYFMFYGPSPLKMATSDELGHWMENPVYLHDCPLDACHRDPMVMRLADGSWLMYATGIHKRYGIVSVFASDDLVNWQFKDYALRTEGNAPYNPPWGATESPYVVWKDGYYYLFITYTNCQYENYHNTLVFRSEDPLDFGMYNGDNESEMVVSKIRAHAPVVLNPEGDDWYITSSGWRYRDTAIEGGVGIARLVWE